MDMCERNNLLISLLTEQRRLLWAGRQFPEAPVKAWGSQKDRTANILTLGCSLWMK